MPNSSKPPYAFSSDLLAQVIRSPRAADSFLSLSDAQQKSLLANIESAPSAEEAKSRLEHTMSVLESGNFDLFRCIQ